MSDKSFDVIVEEIRTNAVKLKDSVTKFTKQTFKKTNSSIGVAKLKFTLNEVETSMEKAYADIGKDVYKQYLNDEPFTEDIIEKCGVVEKYMSEIQKLKEKIAAEKDAVICENCMSMNSADSVYCSKCGYKLNNNSDNAQTFYEDEAEEYEDGTYDEPEVIEIKPKKEDHID